MSTPRPAVFAGRFYPADEGECTWMLDGFFKGIQTTLALGAVLPHAGWVYSGSTAALSIAAIAAFKPETVVIFGAVHVLDRNEASLFPAGSWDTPLGPLSVDEELARRVTHCRHITSDAGPHLQEHSIEVELPLVRRLLPDAAILPLMVRPGPQAEEIGRVCALEAADLGRKVAFLASTDLTHYGPAFGFEPHGRGQSGIRWAKEVNDRRFINLVAEMNAEALVPEAAENRNACGAGATAAMVAAVAELGGRAYHELRHTCSADCEPGEGSHAVNSVGYEAGVFKPAP